MRLQAGAVPASFALVLLLRLPLDIGCASAPRGPRTPQGNPTLVLASPTGERTIPVADLTFVYFKRIFYQRHAPRSEEATGSRVDIEDRRKECLLPPDGSSWPEEQLLRLLLMRPPPRSGRRR